MWTLARIMSLGLLFLGTVVTAPDPSSATANKTTITYWTFLPSGGERPRERGETAIIQAFMEANPGIEVKTEVLPWNEIHRKFLTTFAAGKGPDVLRVLPTQLPLMVKAGTLSPLDRYLSDWPQSKRDDFFDWEGTVIGGQKMAMPIAANVFTLLYRTDLFAEHNLTPPKSWQEFVAVAKALTTENRWGFAFALAREGSYAQALIPPFFWGAGGRILNDEGAAIFNDEHGVAAARFLYELANVHHVSPPEATSFKLRDVMQGFMAGRYSMVIEGANRYSTIQGSDTVRGKVGIAFMPSRSGESYAPSYSTGGWMLGVSANSPNAEAAAAFLKFYSSGEAQSILAEVAGDFPALKSVFDKPFMNVPEKAYLKDFARVLETSARGPILTPHFSELFDRNIIPAMHQIFAGNDPKAVLDKAAESFNKKREGK